jgi:ATP-dependent Clp protease protease subunit
MSNHKLLFEHGIDVVRRTIHINQDIDANVSFNVQMGLSMFEGVDPIIVNINSYGGSAVDGFCIYEMLKRHSNKIITFNTGCAMSAGLLIFMAGEERICLDNCEFMYHGPKDYSEFYGADNKVLEIASKQLKDMKIAMAKLMAESTEKDQRYWTAKANSDFTFKKEEALKLGVITKE